MGSLGAPANAPIALWLSPVSNLAGVSRHIIDVARAGLPGWRLVVAAPRGPLLDELRALGCPVIPFEVDRPVRESVAELRAIVRTLSPVIVHSHLAKADFLAAMAAPGLPTTLVSTEHHVPEEPTVFHGSRAKASLRQIAHHTRIRRFAHLIAVSDSTKRDMLRHWRPTAPITVVKNGVDRPTEATTRSPGLRVLSLTRLAPEKNLPMTLRAFAEVVRDHPDATLTVAGSGERDTETHLRSLARSLGVDDAVTFTGFVDPVRAIAEHDVLVQPSLADNLSYTLLDAVASGMGVVASDIGGNPEILPEHALVPVHGDASANDRFLAQRIVEQGTDLNRRPPLPEDIPTVAQMAERITDVYAAVGQRPFAAPRFEQPTSVTTPSVSVVTAFYKNDATYGAQLDALVAQRDAPPFEVVVADNEGSATLPQLVERYRDRLDIRIVPAADVVGQCHARNVGVRAARADVVALCDADDVVGPRWVRALYDAVREGDVLATGPMRLDVINPEHVLAAKARIEGYPEVPRPRLQGPFPFLGHHVFATGCDLGLRRSTYLDLGGMDETMLGGSEDVDFTWRFIESGRTLVESPDAVVDYRLRTTPREVGAQQYRYMRAQLGFWDKSRRLGRPVRGMSMRWAVTQSVRSVYRLWAARNADLETRYAVAHAAGGTFGNLAGQLAVRGPWHR